MNPLARQFREVTIPVPWGHIAGKWWSPWDARPILCLHGWQDNCGTFDTLIPLLPDIVGFLAVDLPGNGRSSWIPHGMNYYSMDVCFLIQRIKDHFKWKKVSLMGHSQGMACSMIYTMFYPESVDFLIGLDPAYASENVEYWDSKSSELKTILKVDEALQSNAKPPAYLLEVLQHRWCMFASNSVYPENAHHLLNRTVEPSVEKPGCYHLTRDPRHRIRLNFDLSREQMCNGAKRIIAPCLVLQSADTGYFELVNGEKRPLSHKNLEEKSYFKFKGNFNDMLPALRKSSKSLEFHTIDGTHHVHLNHPERVCGLITAFIVKHSIQTKM